MYPNTTIRGELRRFRSEAVPLQDQPKCIRKVCKINVWSTVRTESKDGKLGNRYQRIKANIRKPSNAKPLHKQRESGGRFPRTLSPLFSFDISGPLPYPQPFGHAEARNTKQPAIGEGGCACWETGSPQAISPIGHQRLWRPHILSAGWWEKISQLSLKEVGMGWDGKGNSRWT